MQCHQVRDDEGILGVVNVATAGLEHLRLIAGVFGYTGEWVVHAESLQLSILVSELGETDMKYLNGNDMGLTRTARVRFKLEKTSSYFQDWRSSDRR